jgi:hypothetical protein
MSFKKRRTSLGHRCSECFQSYSRGWVLKRHLREQHHIQTIGDTIVQAYSNKVAFHNAFETLIQMDLATEIRNLNSKLSGVESGSQSTQAKRLAYDVIKPIYAGTQLAIRIQQNFIQKMMEDYILIPKSLVSGFSSYLCLNCLTPEPAVPIKDRGIDLTCQGRHRCGSNSDKLNTLTSDQKLRLATDLFNDLYGKIELWIPGKKLIVAKRIYVSGAKDEDTIRKNVQKEYDVPNKYHLEEIDFQRSPWILKLLRDGKLEPTAEQLNDFCHYCVGTYAIFQVRSHNSVDYYTVFLTSTESLEGPYSNPLNTSPL